MAVDLIIGQEYRRRELHARYGGSQRGGISPSRTSANVLLFKTPGGEQHGYQYDGPRPDGTYWYTGEGQVGDMTFVRGNRAILDAESDGRELHLFEETRKGYVRYVGPAQVVGHHLAPAPDRTGKVRTAIVFELALDSREAAGRAPNPRLPAERPPAELAGKSLAELRNLALQTAPSGAPPAVRKSNAYRRSEAVRLYVLRRAEGICEACKEPAPFTSPSGAPYLEPHHTRRVADGGPDHPRWVAAVCPNCHRRIHYGGDGESFNRQLTDYLGSIEPE